MAARRTSMALLAWLLLSSTSFAQEFKEFRSKQDFFTANFPGDPVVTDITWETEYGAKLPAHVYTATLPGGRVYSLTTVDYNPVQQILTEKSKSCAPGDERCSGDTSFSGAGYWRNDVRGAMLYAASKFLLNRDLKLTHIMWNYLGFEGVEVNQLQFVNNKDQSRTFVNLYMHHSHLYVVQETAPANYPPPGLFVESVSLYEADGRKANHERVYFNGNEIAPEELNQYLLGPNGDTVPRPGTIRGSTKAPK
jgi:hypothetical protein